ncbi:hypothetical protein EYC59_03460 [Candidatus Saccharibacteria bacterium]|nr:MAG: hypothetical protein EYC59_03460 [Candidatus Saccharibacteria bacterium]
MKQKDIALILVIAVVSGIISFVVSGKIFVTPQNRSQKVEVVDKISTDFQQPSDKYFNEQSVDPTQPVEVGENNNQSPFDSGNQ